MYRPSMPTMRDYRTNCTPPPSPSIIPRVFHSKSSFPACDSPNAIGVFRLPSWHNDSVPLDLPDALSNGYVEEPVADNLHDYQFDIEGVFQRLDGMSTEFDESLLRSPKFPFNIPKLPVHKAPSPLPGPMVSGPAHPEFRANSPSLPQAVRPLLHLETTSTTTKLVSTARASALAVDCSVTAPHPAASHLASSPPKTPTNETPSSVTSPSFPAKLGKLSLVPTSPPTPPFSPAVITTDDVQLAPPGSPASAMRNAGGAPQTPPTTAAPDTPEALGAHETRDGNVNDHEAFDDSPDSLFTAPSSPVETPSAEPRPATHHLAPSPSSSVREVDEVDGDLEPGLVTPLSEATDPPTSPVDSIAIAEPTVNDSNDVPSTHSTRVAPSSPKNNAVAPPAASSVTATIHTRHAESAPSVAGHVYAVQDEGVVQPASPRLGPPDEGVRISEPYRSPTALSVPQGSCPTPEERLSQRDVADQKVEEATEETGEEVGEDAHPLIPQTNNMPSFPPSSSSSFPLCPSTAVSHEAPQFEDDIKSPTATDAGSKGAPADPPASTVPATTLSQPIGVISLSANAPHSDLEAAVSVTAAQVEHVDAMVCSQRTASSNSVNAMASSLNGCHASPTHSESPGDSTDLVAVAREEPTGGSVKEHVVSLVCTPFEEAANDSVDEPVDEPISHQSGDAVDMTDEPIEAPVVDPVEAPSEATSEQRVDITTVETTVQEIAGETTVPTTESDGPVEATLQMPASTVQEQAPNICPDPLEETANTSFDSGARGEERLTGGDELPANGSDRTQVSADNVPTTPIPNDETPSNGHLGLGSTTYHPCVTVVPLEGEAQLPGATVSVNNDCDEVAIRHTLVETTVGATGASATGAPSVGPSLHNTDIVSPCASPPGNGGAEDTPAVPSTESTTTNLASTVATDSATDTALVRQSAVPPSLPSHTEEAATPLTPLEQFNTMVAPARGEVATPKPTELTAPPSHEDRLTAPTAQSSVVVPEEEVGPHQQLAKATACHNEESSTATVSEGHTSAEERGATVTCDDHLMAEESLGSPTTEQNSETEGSPSTHSGPHTACLPVISRPLLSSSDSDINHSSTHEIATATTGHNDDVIHQASSPPPPHDLDMSSSDPIDTHEESQGGGSEAAKTEPTPSPALSKTMGGVDDEKEEFAAHVENTTYNPTPTLNPDNAMVGDRVSVDVASTTTPQAGGKPASSIGIMALLATYNSDSDSDSDADTDSHSPNQTVRITATPAGQAEEPTSSHYFTVKAMAAAPYRRRQIQPFRRKSVISFLPVLPVAFLGASQNSDNPAKDEVSSGELSKATSKLKGRGCGAGAYGEVQALQSGMMQSLFASDEGLTAFQAGRVSRSVKRQMMLNSEESVTPGTKRTRTTVSDKVDSIGLTKDTASSSTSLPAPTTIDSMTASTSKSKKRKREVKDCATSSDLGNPASADEHRQKSKRSNRFYSTEEDEIFVKVLGKGPLTTKPLPKVYKAILNELKAAGFHHRSLGAIRFRVESQFVGKA